ncbi:MAG: hypothetical protein ABIH99_05405 [Candidatus Micrarchaeota archaeon]
MSHTTIRVSGETLQKLAAMREYARETYDEVINKLLDLVPSGDDEGEYTEEFKASWMRAHEDLKKGRIISHAELKKKLGV